MRYHELGFNTLSAAVAALGLVAVTATGARAADAVPRLPSFVDAGRVTALPSARDDAAEERDAALLRSADEARRRAEEERLKAIEVRRQAEALSMRFAAEIPAAAVDSAPAVLERTSVTTATPVVTGSIANEVAAVTPPATPPAVARARQAELELQEARDALAKARAELEEATRKAHEAAVPRMVAEDVKPAAPAKAQTTAKHAKAPPAKTAPPARAEPDRRIAVAPPTVARPVETAAPSGTAIQGPTMGRQPQETPAVAAAATENPITGLISKVFGGGGNTQPSVGFNQ